MTDTLKIIKRIGVLEHLYPKAMWKLPLVGMSVRNDYVRFIGLPSEQELDEAEENMKWQQEFFERFIEERR